ncbi:MAG: GNAT family N-acetyltransferase [Armatimonas sp.]
MVEITLFLLDREAAESLAANPVAFADEHGWLLAPHEATVVEIAALTARLLAENGQQAPWVGYLALDVPQRRVVGTCGFNGGPDATGTVELAYFTFPEEEGQGIATAMAMALVRLASEAPSGIVAVRAHTLPERNASCRVLEKVGFQYVGTATAPNEGIVWRWELPSTRSALVLRERG